MKTQTATVRSTFTRAFFAGLLAMSSFSVVKAQNANKPEADIRYAGTYNDKLIFEVDYKNDTQEPFTLEIKDGEGYVFYNSRFKEKSFRKYFALDKSELFKTSITIQVATKNAIQKQVFDVNTTTKTVDEISVVKL